MAITRTTAHRSRRRLTLLLVACLLISAAWAVPASADLVGASNTNTFQPQLTYDPSAPACPAANYATTRYVDVGNTSASDGNPGTESQPWRTLVHAASTAATGTRVFVGAGIYNHGDVAIENGGTCFTAYPGQEHLAIVRGAGIISHENSNLVINGFKFENSPEHSIRIVGPNAQNIVVTNNHTYDTAKSAVSIRGVTGHADPGNYDNMRNVLVAGNLIELANHGDGGEIISVGSGVINADVAYNELRIGDPVFGDGDEGISFKEGVRDSRIFGNVIHNLSDKAISIDGGSSSHDPLVTNIEIFDNVFYDLPANGMWVTTEGQGDVDGVHIHDNIVYNAEGNGILVYEHPDGRSAGGTVRNILIEHNTVWNNGRHSGYGGIRVDHPSAPGVVIRDNIAWDNNGYDIEGDNGTTIDGPNLCREAVLCNITGDPRFVNPPTDFELRTGSPAIGAATDGTDLGARTSSTPPPPPPPPPPPNGHTVGLVDPSHGRWYLYNATGAPVATFFFGNPGDYPFMGDWDGDGVETPGLYRQSDGYVYLRNSNTQGVADIKFFFGNPGDVPIAGDFNNDGFDTVSIYRPSNQTFYIVNKLGANNGGLGSADLSYVFGNPGDKPFVGDFDGDGIETAGLHRESTGLVYFRNTHTQGNADSQFIFGDPGDRFVAGDWTSDGVFTPALFRPSNTTVYFRYSNTQGNANYYWTGGQTSWLPIAGKMGG